MPRPAPRPAPPPRASARGVWASAALLAALLVVAAPAAAQTGSVAGTVTDAATGDPLPGASVRIAETVTGAAADVDGRYEIDGAPTGRQLVVASFVGYAPDTVAVEVPAGGVARADFALALEATLDEVEVVGLLEGQQRAISEQLESNQIVNVVSEDRLRELPDANAAESLGRLPGVGVQRDAGEGSKVVVRGLSPRFNSVTVNGERLPSTDGADRSVDLSAISPDVLAGIEVYKALTPDQDGDAIGGTINLVVRRAPSGLRYRAEGQYGYNGLTEELGQYRANASASNRFAGDALGLLVTAGTQKVDRSSDVFDATYNFVPSDNVSRIEDLNLVDRIEDRRRYNASAALDADLGGAGSILLSSFLSRTDRDELRRRKRYRVDSGTVEYDLRDRELSTTLLSNTLSGEHPVLGFVFDWQGSYARTLQREPTVDFFRFQEVGGYLTGLVDNEGPEVIPPFARNDLSATTFLYATQSPERTVDESLTAQVNLRRDVALGPVVGYLKTGAKVRQLDRVRDATELRTPFGTGEDIVAMFPDRFDAFRARSLAVTNFVDEGFSAPDFLSGDYAFDTGLDRDALVAFREEFGGMYDVNRLSLLDNYVADEEIRAGYVMAELNWGRVMVLPGVRYEQTTNNYRGNVGRLRGQLGDVGTIRDSTGGRTYGEWLPMAHLRVRFTRVLDLRLAFTKTLSRPDYFNLVPFERVNTSDREVTRGNPNTLHTTSLNYDAFVSYFTPRLGLLTAGLFYKDISNVDYVRVGRITGDGAEFRGFELTEPTNAETSEAYGFEVDLQTNLSFLPGPLSDVVLNANYSRIWSETLYPFLETGPPDPVTFIPTVVDTFRVGRLPGQASYLANLSVGYEAAGFTGRVSMTYQDDVTSTIGFRAEEDGFTAGFARWDAAVSQDVARGLEVFLNVNNFTDQPDGAFLGNALYPTQRERFGWTGEVGLRFRR